MAASRARHGVLAAWSRGHVRLSRDDGRTFADALAGAGDVTAVAIGDDGTLFVVRGERRLGVRAPGGAEAWRELPFAGGGKLLASAHGWLAWLGDGALALSRDAGRAWRFLPLPYAVEHLSPVIDEAGAVELLGVRRDDGGDRAVQLTAPAGASHFAVEKRDADLSLCGSDGC